MKNIMQKLFQKKYLIYWVLGIAAVLSLGGSLLIVMSGRDITDVTEDALAVTDFDSCVEETGVILESFPEQCVYEGETYTNPRQSLGGDGLSDTSLPTNEEKQILTWIEENNLNAYGDPQGTVYTGGTPLFDESTGTYLPLYDYLIATHPDKPWMDAMVDTNDFADGEEAQDQTPGSSGEALIFSDIDDWVVYEDPKFRLDYPGSPIDVQVADANGYPVRMYTFDGFEVFLGIDENPQPDFTCSERQLVGGSLFFCHNGDPQYLSVYEYMLESIVAL